MDVQNGQLGEGAHPVAQVDWRQIAERRGRRAHRLEQRCEYLAAENERLNRLLACTLTIACASTDVDEGRLLEVVSYITGDDLARAAKFT